MKNNIYSVLSFDDFSLLCGFKNGTSKDYFRVLDILEENDFQFAKEIVYMQLQYQISKGHSFDKEMTNEFLKIHYDYLAKYTL